MPTFDTVKREFPRVEVLRGYDPNEPTTATGAFRASEAILSGQIISPKWNATDSVYEWVKGVNSSEEQIYVAINDSTDEDVISAGTLPGLSCSGQFEIETAFFKTGETYNVGVQLTYDGATGNVKPVTATDGSETVIGEITRNHGLKSLAGINSNVEVDNLDVISFRTYFQRGNTALADAVAAIAAEHP